MGAISRIRQISPYFLATVAVLFIAFMVIQDSSCSSVQQGPRNPATIVVGTVNGQDIYMAEYEARVKAAIDAQKQQNPNAEVDDEGLRQSVWDEMVNEILRKQQAEKMGLFVTKQELLDAFFVNPPDYLTQMFKDSTGKINMQLYRDVMSNPDNLGQFIQGGEEDKARYVAQFKTDLLKIEDYILTSKLDEALRAAVGAAGSVISPAFAEQDYRTTNSSADVKFVALDANMIPDAQVNVSDADISAYYEKNKQYFEQKKSRRIKYMLFPMVPSAKDTQTAQNRSGDLQLTFARLATPESKDSAFTVEMSAKNGQTIDFRSVSDIESSTATILTSMTPREVFGPLTTPEGIKYLRLDERRDGVNPQVRASHILIDFGLNKDSAKVTADRVIARAKKGEDFAALARENSKDPGSAVNGGDLGFFGKGRMVKPFEDAAFSGNVGDIVGPVETQFGYHIIKIVDKQSAELKYSEITIKPVVSTGTRQKILADAATAVKQIEGGSPLDSVAKKFKVKSNESPFFQIETPILGSREITRFAFDESKGAVKSFDLRAQNVAVVQLTDVREAGIQPLDDIKQQLRQKLLVDKKMDKLKARAEDLAAKLQAQGIDAAPTIDPTAEVRVMTQLRNNGQLQGFGNEFDATQAAFKVPVGNVSKAIRGNRAWFVIQPTSRQEADMSKFAAERTFTVQTLSGTAKNAAYSLWFQKLREHAEIEDLRYQRD